MKTVVLDCDGVLANFVGSFTEFGGEGAARYQEYGDIQDYNAEQWPGWTPKMIEAAWDRIHGTPNWFYGLKPIDATRANVWALIRLSEATKLYVVTARRDHAGSPMNELTQHWIEEHFSAHTSVIATDGWRKKLLVVEALEPHYVIDDAPYLLDEFKQSRVLQSCGTVVVARDWRYNREAPCHARVRTLEEFAQVAGVPL